MGIALLVRSFVYVEALTANLGPLGGGESRAVAGLGVKAEWQTTAAVCLPIASLGIGGTDECVRPYIR